MLAIPVDTLVVGQEFSKWPKHITLLPWFNDAKQEVLDESLQTLAAKTKPIVVSLGERALYGSKNNRPVLEIVHNNQLRDLHITGLNIVANDAKAKLEDLRYVGYKFKPHITVPMDEFVYAPLALEEMALIDDIGHGERRVREVYSLDG